MTKSNEKNSGEISRREFLKDAGLLVGGTAIGSTVLLAACGGETEAVTDTITNTTTKTVTTTEQVGEVTKTETKTVSKFVCPYCSEEFDSLAELQVHMESEHGEAASPEALDVINLTVNGQVYEVQVEPHWTLWKVLREKVGMLSVKDMCTGWGACGSCGVIMDGRPVLSCMALAIECDGVTIETSEGIAVAKHPLIDTYIDNDCMQCGYCTPGFIVTAKALLDRKPNPTEADIREALGGNICRCGTYPQHITAVSQAAQRL